MARILWRIEWPADIEDDPVAIRRAEFDAVTADLLSGAVNRQLSAGHDSTPDHPYSLMSFASPLHRTIMPPSLSFPMWVFQLSLPLSAAV